MSVGEARVETGRVGYGKRAQLRGSGKALKRRHRGVPERRRGRRKARATANSRGDAEGNERRGGLPASAEPGDCRKRRASRRKELKHVVLPCSLLFDGHATDLG